MATTTPVFGWPVPDLNDGPNGPQQITDLADAIETTVNSGLVSPIGDSSHSQVLTGGDISFTANDNKNILTTGAITFTRNQWVLIAGKCAVHNQTSSASGLFALYIDLDSVPISGASSGAIWVGAQGNITERMQFSIPMLSVFVTAGSHTIRLRGDRDSTIATHNVDATDTLNQTHHPTSLTVIV